MNPQYIVVHCSDSPFGSVEVIDSWHRARGWSMVGYHYVVCNGHETSSRASSYEAHKDGLVQSGRLESSTGAHARGYNTKSLGVCLIGKDGHFTANQMVSMYSLLCQLMWRYSIPVDNVIGHYETALAGGKTCPDMDMSRVREKLTKVYGQFINEMTC